MVPAPISGIQENSRGAANGELAACTLKLGILKETKNPPDRRVLLTPEQCARIMEHSRIKIVVQRYHGRCYSDREYEEAGVELVDYVDDCHVLLGVKEVRISSLISNKFYFFFSHTIKQQPYNAPLLASIINKNIQLVDYECLKDAEGKRVIAFGRWAGIVGAHNTIMAWGKRKGLFTLPRLYQCLDFEEGSRDYKKIDLRGIRLVLTGTGRVSSGSVEVLSGMGFKKVTPKQFLELPCNETDSAPVFTQIKTRDIFQHKQTGQFESSFYMEPDSFQSVILPYLKCANILINGIFWDHRGPAFFSLEDIQSPDWKVEVIGDITCDIAPKASIPTTVRATEIPTPFFGFHRFKKREVSDAFGENVITMMTVDNLPNELPRDASADFGEQFVKYVLPELKQEMLGELEHTDGMIHSATIAKNGKLMPNYHYLSGYLRTGMRKVSHA